ncbi:hypothetical protein OQ252_09085 [Acetobacter farinalis]|uniref:Uncharacterized protein n=1 Tax=Acetobacter farinalis TaxID=1260984 RepID=A0ABT3Q8C6_9PROT|nr:hypothetical protein [Acetobacter farinalis]MCX2561547.1 hypothetical protein [Acetobacter farinalis]NHO30766.1 hypothetical protein [Acetobacter farinalis]
MSSKIDLTLSEDHTTVHMILPGQEGAPTVDVQLSVEEVTSLITVLGRLRQTMMTNHEIPPIEGATFTPVTRTRWAVQPEARTDGSLLAFQHPAYGPIGLVLTPQDAERLVRGLNLHEQMRRDQQANRGKLN